jgi:hypothetical protein
MKLIILDLLKCNHYSQIAYRIKYILDILAYFFFFWLIASTDLYLSVHVQNEVLHLIEPLYNLIIKNI